MSVPDVTDAERREAQRAAAAKASDPETLTQLQRDVAALVGMNRIVQDKFVEVGVKLTGVDTGRLPDGSAVNPGQPFFPAWDALRVRFNNLVNRSNDTASTIGTYCKSFNDVILPFALDMAGGPPLSKEQKIAMVQGFQDSATAFHAEATRTKEEFENLSSDVAQFGTRFDGFAADRIQNNRDLIIQADNRIRTLQGEIASLQTQINILIISAGLTAVGAGVGAAIFPGFGLLILLAGAAAVVGMIAAIIVLQNQVAEKEGEIVRQNRVKEELMAVIAQLEATQSVLGGIRTDDIPTITGALTAFSGVWQQVIASCNQVKGYLELAGTPGIIDTPPVVYGFLTEANSVYGSLGQGMIDYAAGIHGPDTFTRADKLKAQHNLPKWARISPAVHKAVCRLVEERGVYATF